jgi:hypothetical protein
VGGGRWNLFGARMSAIAENANEDGAGGNDSPTPANSRLTLAGIGRPLQLLMVIRHCQGLDCDGCDNSPAAPSTAS